MGDLTPRISHRPLIWPDVVLDLQALLLDGESSQPAYIVGGAVRDALLHRPLTDIDLATPHDGIQLARRIANALNGDFFVLDTARDVGRALIDTAAGRFIVDVSGFRGADLLADLEDRDFTINAMAVDLRGQIDLLIDPLNGEQDAQAKIIRRCNATSLADDPLRALRAVRQSVQLGMRLEPDTLNDVRAAVSALSTVSAERIRDEFIKLLALEKSRAALRVAGALGLLDEIVPEVSRLEALPAIGDDYADRWQETLAVVEKLAHVLTAISPRRSDHTGATFGVGMLIIQLDTYRSQLQVHVGRRWPNERPHAALLVLAALMLYADEDKHQSTVAVAAMVGARARALRLSNDERERLLALVRYHRLPFELGDLSPLAIHRFWRQTGEAGIDVCLLAATQFLGAAGSDIDHDSWLALVERLRALLEAWYDRHDSLVEPPTLLDGNQLMARLSLDPGPLIGALLDHIREGQVTGVVGSIDDALALARAYLKEHI